MFLRLGWVVGQVGVVQATLIIVAANVVTLITTLSLCAICTNGVVKGGGAYYLISRNLGPQFGGAIGLLFFLAQAVATSLYVVGFAESLQELLVVSGVPAVTDPANDKRIIGVAVMVLMLCMALVGVGWYAKTQTGLLLILVVAILSVVIGAFLPAVPDAGENVKFGFVGAGNVGFGASNKGAVENPGGSLDPDTSTKVTFMYAFAVFFPAVTGIMAGANMSGDLASPSTAIPTGTLLGIAVTFVSYIGLTWLLGVSNVQCVGQLSAPDNTHCIGDDCCSLASIQSLLANDVDLVPLGGLLYNKLIMKNMSAWAPLIYAGVFAATLSSALASLVGAPRILQALARDRLFDFEWFFYFSQLPSSARADPDTDASTGPRARSSVAKDGDEGDEAKAGSDPEAAEAAAEVDVDDMESPEPIRGYFLTFVIATACVLIGELNYIAPIISNFFLISYALVNLACALSTFTQAPGWRPTFGYYNSYVSLVGGILCLGLMFTQLDTWYMAVAAVAIGLVVYAYLARSDPDVAWGPASESIKYVKSVQALSALKGVRLDDEGRGHVKTFRPAFLVLVDDSRGLGVSGHKPSRTALSFATKLYKGQGVTVAAAVIPCPPSGPTRTQLGELRRRRTALQGFLDRGLVLSYRQRAVLYADVVTAPSLRFGAVSLMQTSGLGLVRPNTVVWGYPTGGARRPLGRIREFEGMLGDAIEARMGTMVVRDESERFFDSWLRPKASEMGRSRRQTMTTGVTSGTSSNVDVWWLADDGGLSLLVPFLLRRNPQFCLSDAIRVMTVGDIDGSDMGMDRTVVARSRGEALTAELRRLRLPAAGESFPLRTSDIHQASIDRFNAAYPGLLPDGLTGNPSPAPAGRPATSSRAVRASIAGGGAASAVAAAASTSSAAAAGASCPADLPADRRAALVTLTQRLLRTGEVMREKSAQSAVVFAVLPWDSDLPPGLVTAWMDVLSHDLPPFVFIRGNGEAVMTDES